MARRLILDTGVLIEIERGRLGVNDVVGDDDDIVVPAVVVAEFRAGMILGPTIGRRLKEQFLTLLLAEIPVIPYDQATAMSHAELLAWSRRQGLPRGPHDLIIAATAIATSRTLMTTDRKARFDAIPGLDVEVLLVAPS